MRDLHTASREDLIRLVLAQHERIAALEAVVADQRATITRLEATVAQMTQRVGELLAVIEAGSAPPGGSGASQGMPGLKPATGKVRPPKQPRKGRAQQFVRQRAEPTQRIIHACDHCPTCGVALSGGSVKRTREVIEVPLVPAVVTEHVSLERRCPQCGTRHTPAVDLAGQAVGKQRFGVGLVSLIATLREEARLPVRMIQWYLATFHALSVSAGAIVGAMQQVAHAGARALTAMCETIRGSPRVNVDETGWREDGENGYVWTFCTPTARYFVRGSRAGAMVDTVLGDDFAGVLVSDFYAGYARYPGVKQKCWAHLLRDVHDVRVAHADDAAVQAWAAGVHDLYLRAVAWRREHAEAAPMERQRASARFAAELHAVYGPDTERAVPQRTLSRRMDKHLHELFVFVTEPQVPSDNNEAERSLRHLVTSRKISGGTQSAAGSAIKMVLASLFGTWRVRGENPFTACRALLISPHP
jgi:hypothetical protein